MHNAFRPAPLALLARWIFGELDARDTVLGIPKQNLAIPGRRLASRMFGRHLAAPLGVAAGPHTQLAQNIVASWLCGARFIELKTVQIRDEITVRRPCIDSADETYNCEWSQELKLEQSFDEYLAAWVLVHALAHRLGLDGPGALFGMSLGYDLAGIQSPRVQRFVSSMRDARHALPAAVDAVAQVYPAVRDVDIPSRISDHVTLSTMHGCPPAEIERIARYLLGELGVHTWVKLNPTLLGAERLRGILNRTLGFDIEVPDEAFEHDPRFDDAVGMAKRLARAAEGRPQSFGVKLSNTLEVVNRRRALPPAERTTYLSGRALHPLTLTLARHVTEALEGRVAVSFCGGADAESFADLVADGLSPVTVCTDLLKPGGYARLQQYLANLDAAMERAGAESLDAFVEARGARASLARHAERVLSEARYARRERPLAFKGERALGHFDCIAAPCQEACPAHQDVPDYLWLVSQGRPSDAMEVILRTNPQPGITGSVCDHPCTSRCVRSFYDAPLAIRELKRHAFEHGRAPAERARPANGVKVAIVGAGPAGLSAAYYLARAGFEPAVFEAQHRLGGMVSAVIPSFRLAEHAIEEDLERVRRLGVPVHLGKALGREVTLPALREQYRYVFLAVGAQRGRRLGVPGEEAAGVLDALELLNAIAAGTRPALGRRVLVVGGGNSAVDAARSARRLVADGEVALVYRRTRAEMPADPAEVRECVAEGVVLRELLAPARVLVEGGRVVGLACARMKLVEPDASGRPRPVSVDGSEVVLPADAIVAATGQEPALEFLDALVVERRGDGTLAVDPETCETSVPGVFAGGDVARGPSSVIQAIADGRAVARAILRRHGVADEPEPALDKRTPPAALLARKALRAVPREVAALPATGRGGFAGIVRPLGPAAAAEEASRCLDCDDLCSLCVTVCPNRANVAYETSPFAVELPSLVARGGALVAGPWRSFEVRQRVQILNLGDFCNECGNCSTFCPTSGAPHRSKPKFWLDAQGWEQAAGDAFRMERAEGVVAVEARVSGASHRLERRARVAEYRSGKLVARFDPESWSLLGWEAVGALVEGEELDLGPCATLIALLQAEPAIPR